jgi:hypothetical protein
MMHMYEEARKYGNYESFTIFGETLIERDTTQLMQLFSHLASYQDLKQVIASVRVDDWLLIILGTIAWRLDNDNKEH